MSSMKQNMFPSLCNISYNVALKTYSALLCQLLFMGPKLTAGLKQKSSSDIMKQVVRPLHKSGRFIDQNKVRFLVTKGALDSNLHVRKGLEMGLYKIHVVVINAESEDVVTTFDLNSFRRPHAENGYGLEPSLLEITLTDLLVRLIDFSHLKCPILMAFFQQLLKTKLFAKEDEPTYTEQSILNVFCRQLLFETREYAKDLLTKCFVSVSSNRMNSDPFCRQLPSQTKELAKNLEKPAEKPVSSTASNITAVPQVSSNLPEKISMKTVKLCTECREPIRMKKFFDERRFGIMEKCKCVICYGCIRKLTGTTDRVVKGPVRCPICFAMSDNVASSAHWIQVDDKVEFFEKYCKNVQNTNIKMRLGWTSFPTRKDDLWARAP